MLDKFIRTIWMGVKLLFGVLMLLMCGLGLMSGGKSETLDQFSYLEGEGQVAKAKVLDIERRETLTTRRGNAVRHALGTESYEYYVAFEFQPTKGPVHKDTLRVLKGDPAAIKVGGTVEVLYHPENPKVKRLVQFSDPYTPSDPQSRMTTSLVFLGLGLVTLMWNLRRFVSSTAPEATETAIERLERRPIRDDGSTPAPQQSRSPAPATAPRRVETRSPVRTAQGFGARNRA